MSKPEHYIQIRQVSNGYMVKYQFGKASYSLFSAGVASIETQEFIASSVKEALQMTASAVLTCDEMTDAVIDGRLKLAAGKAMGDV